ncbi:pyridoxamine 5'-phosphate oxidase family protein [Aestuariispira insulae]|uniref:Pyridoxamine 5'-phosphate oxidase N-terminal domain-containing protein n=1 Tax=Aestuariispira insulae TaxID=1461337 RepID=A0A3D9HHZ6_9PROT|nr:pyridoxamine 5'-phosphate oxidase family protein [Aestuariispira insulae]RED49117.1 hypothetical protein DFP90_10694 [Aestuariispira insulae]
MARIETVKALREIYRKPQGRALQKQLDHLEFHGRNFIAKSPFLVLGTSTAGGMGDVSPRGDLPGFVKVLDDHTVILPDRPGNNRLDSLNNIIENPAVSLIFFLPGVNETFRINGEAEISTDEDLLDLCVVDGKRPVTVLKITVREAYLHCAKSMMRSNLWSSEIQIDRKDLPTMGRMINDQIGEQGPAESQQEMEARYKKALY